MAGFLLILSFALCAAFGVILLCATISQLRNPELPYPRHKRIKHKRRS